jgi:chloramphenicol-sensitive protein RarD
MADTPLRATAKRSEAQVGVLYGLSAFITWGLLTIYWKQLKSFSPIELIGWRIAASTIILVALMAAQHRLLPLLQTLRNRQVLTRVVLASVMLSINWFTYVWAVVNGHVIETALGYFISPILTLVIGLFILHEHLRRVQRVAVGFAVMGVAILTIAYGQIPTIALALSGSWAIYGLLKKQVTLAPLESLTAEVLVVFVPAMVMVAASWHNGGSIVNSATLTEWVFVALIGIVTAVPLLFFAGAAQRVPLTVLGPLQYFVPTITFLLGWLIYDEDVSVTKLMGFASIWVCLAIVVSDSLRSRQSV